MGWPSNTSSDTPSNGLSDSPVTTASNMTSWHSSSNSNNADPDDVCKILKIGANCSCFSKHNENNIQLQVSEIVLVCLGTIIHLNSKACDLNLNSLLQKCLHTDAKQQPSPSQTINFQQERLFHHSFSFALDSMETHGIHNN